MPEETREWTVPAPLRALMWWPAAAFVLVVIAPEAATASIALAGAVLATLGVMLPAIARRLRGVVRAGNTLDPGGELAAMDLPVLRQAV